MKSSKSAISLIVAIVSLLAMAFLTACSKKPETGSSQSNVHNHSGASANPTSGKQLYQCSMHPNVISDRPGKCPICGMDLQPVKQIKEKGIPGRAAVQLTNVQQQLINIRVAPVERAEAARAMRAVGIITYDETKVADLNSKVKGWVQKLYVDKPGQPVKAGDPLMALYSPDLYSAQQEYLLAYQKKRGFGKATGLSAQMRKFSSDNNKTESSLLRSARKRLELWDISAPQIKALEESGTPKDTLELTAPITGVVVEKNVLPAQMINPGMLLYRIADLSDVWVDAEVYEYELSLIKVGQKGSINVDAYPGKTFEGEISFIYPYLQNKTRTAKVRLVLRNPDELLKPGMYANVTIESGLGDQLLIPASAIFDTGNRQYVFVQAEPGVFAPKEIGLGAKSGDRIVVIKGLEGNEQVVVDGNFLLDSESQLKAAAGGSMQMPMPAEGHHH
ncbi:MAG TPA: efflux RND transporter periplasmic adaptor subunit [Candidatus Udaeobacter sp.]